MSTSSTPAARPDPDTLVSQAMAEGGRAYQAGQLEQAAAAFGRAALLQPSNTHAQMNLGVTLRRLGRLDAALTCYARAAAVDSENAALNSNLGNALREVGRLEEAEFHLTKARQSSPQDASFAYNLALLLRDRRKTGTARDMMAALLRDHPGNADYAWDLALTDLYLKDYRQGFAGYESRWGLARTPRRELPGPMWRPGGDLSGKTVLIAAEQGFGDALQFARFLPLVAQRCARLVVECLPELTDLFAAIPGVAQVVEKHQPLPGYDIWAPMMSLAWLLDVTWDDLPAPAAYLAPPGRLSRPLGRPPGTRLNVGLIWAGKLNPRDRSWPLEKLLPLMHDPALAFWGLQVGERVADVLRLGLGGTLRDLSPHLTSFGATAAFMAEMDLIVTIDTSAAHLAGALGRPTWVLLRYVSDWRWLDEGETCAWYPTMRLFRQCDPADFDGPVAAVKAALAGFSAPMGV